MSLHKECYERKRARRRRRGREGKGSRGKRKREDENKEQSNEEGKEMEGRTGAVGSYIFEEFRLEFSTWEMLWQKIILEDICL